MDSRKTFFDRWAATYDTHLPRFPEYCTLVESIANAIADRVNNKPSARVLDVGIGTGIVATVLCQRCPNVSLVGVDSSQSMLEQVDDDLSHRIELLCTDMISMNLGDCEFDAAYASFAIHHSTDKQKTLNDIRSSMRPNGLFVLGEVVVDVDHTHPRYLESVIRRWGYTALHAQRCADDNAARLELEILKMVYERDGEYLETPEEWAKLLKKCHLLVTDHIVIDEDLGYHLWFANKRMDDQL